MEGMLKSQLIICSCLCACWFASGQFSGLVLFDSLHCLCSCGFMVALFFSTVSCVVDDVDDDDDDGDDGDNDNW